MINKEDFIRYMNHLMQEEDFTNSMMDLFSKNREIVRDSEFFGCGLSDDIVELLERSFGLVEDENGYTDLSYYIYHSDYGRDEKCYEDLMLYDVDDNHKYKYPIKEIKNDFDKLYDYLVWSKGHDRQKGQ